MQEYKDFAPTAFAIEDAVGIVRDDYEANGGAIWFDDGEQVLNGECEASAIEGLLIFSAAWPWDVYERDSRTWELIPENVFYRIGDDAEAVIAMVERSNAAKVGGAS